MKVVIDADERYPDYSVREANEYDVADKEWSPPVVDIPDATVKRWRRAIAAYVKVQNEMAVEIDVAEEAAAREAYMKANQT